MGRKKQNQQTVLFHVPSIEKTKKELKQVFEFKRPFEEGFLSEANCYPGTWKFLRREISEEECKRLDEEYERQQAQKGLPS